MIQLIYFHKENIQHHKIFLYISALFVLLHLFGFGSGCQMSPVNRHNCLDLKALENQDCRTGPTQMHWTAGEAITR